MTYCYFSTRLRLVCASIFWFFLTCAELVEASSKKNSQICLPRVSFKRVAHSAEPARARLSEREGRSRPTQAQLVGLRGSGNPDNSYF